MKKTISTLALFLSAMYSISSIATPAPTREVTIGLSEVYIPGGFSSTTDAYVVVSGMFPNSCYHWSRPEVKHSEAFKHDVRAIAEVSQMMCLMVLVPFQKEVALGRLQSGEHTLRFLNGDGTYFKKAFPLSNAMNKRTLTSLVVIGIGLGGLTLSLPSCSKAPNWTNVEWSGDKDGTPPRAPNLTAKSNLKLAGQQIEFYAQTVDGIPIEDSYVKTLGRDGTLKWAKANFLDEKNLPSPSSVRNEAKRKEKVAERMDALAKTLNCKFSGDLEPELRWKTKWTLVFKRPCEAPSGELYEIVFNSRGKMLSHDLVGANMAMEESLATLYPKGPKVSQLKTLAVSVSTIPNYLLTSGIEVVSDTGLKFSQLTQISQAAPSEDRFDMLQAYYFSSQALEWVSKHMHFQAGGLKLRTHVGHPDKNNVAFYFNREIRIGSGDDVVYSHMAWDPSIVIHEIMHGIIESLTHLPLGKGEGGSLQEALADILTALQLDNPQMGEASYKEAPYQRTLVNNFKLGDKTGKLYHDSLILSGTLWEIKVTAGAPVVEEILIFLLGHLAHSSQFDDVKKQLKSWLESAPEQNPAVEKILSQRGWL